VAQRSLDTIGPALARPVRTSAAGTLGILGGLALLVALVVEVPAALNGVRIVLFHVGVIAVGLGIYPWHARTSRWLAAAASVPVLVTNAWSAGWIVLPAAQRGLGSGTIGLVLLVGAIALWGSMVWFGILAIRAGVLWRSASLLLVVGAALAVTGMSRLGLTSDAQPTIFAPLSLFGIAGTGVAWILLGVDLLLLGRARVPPGLPSGRAEASA